jgi:hypothetical protein
MGSADCGSAHQWVDVAVVPHVDRIRTAGGQITADEYDDHCWKGVSPIESAHFKQVVRQNST